MYLQFISFIKNSLNLFKTLQDNLLEMAIDQELRIYFECIESLNLFWDKIFKCMV